MATEQTRSLWNRVGHGLWMPLSSGSCPAGLGVAGGLSLGLWVPALPLRFADCGRDAWLGSSRSVHQGAGPHRSASRRRVRADRPGHRPSLSLCPGAQPASLARPGSPRPWESPLALGCLSFQQDLSSGLGPGKARGCRLFLSHFPDGETEARGVCRMSEGGTPEGQAVESAVQAPEPQEAGGDAGRCHGLVGLWGCGKVPERRGTGHSGAPVLPQPVLPVRAGMPALAHALQTAPRTAAPVSHSHAGGRGSCISADENDFISFLFPERGRVASL